MKSKLSTEIWTMVPQGTTTFFGVLRGGMRRIQSTLPPPPLDIRDISTGSPRTEFDIILWAVDWIRRYVSSHVDNVSQQNRHIKPKTITGIR